VDDSPLIVRHRNRNCRAAIGHFKPRSCTWMDVRFWGAAKSIRTSASGSKVLGGRLKVARDLANADVAQPVSPMSL